MKHKIIILCVVAVVLALVYFCSFSIYENKKGTVMIGKKTFSAEIVSADLKRQRGLGGRNSLCKGCSMLFVFPSQDLWGIWMKGMKFDLDIIWISGNRIVKIEKKVSKDSKNTLYPEEQADKVLELNAGAIDEKGIRVGDMVEIK